MGGAPARVLMMRPEWGRRKDSESRMGNNEVIQLSTLFFISVEIAILNLKQKFQENSDICYQELSFDCCTSAVWFGSQLCGLVA